MYRATGFDGTVKVWNVDPSLDDLTTEVVSTARYFDKEAVGAGDVGDGFVHLGKVSWHPEVGVRERGRERKRDGERGGGGGEARETEKDGKRERERIKPRKL